MPSALQVVWFKRDLRVEDHRPLFEATRTGAPVLALYVYEPEMVGAPDFDASHLVFLNQSLAELDLRLRALGGRLTCRAGRLPDVFDQLHVEHGLAGLWSHEETGNGLSYARDRRVAAWCRQHAVPWTELPQHGVCRPHPSRDGWAQRWSARMAEPLTPAPRELSVVPAVEPGRILSPADLGLPASTKTLAQPGGESHGHRLLDSFLERRGLDYRRAMSAPLPAWRACSRLSAHLAFGCVSVRQVFQATRERQREVAEVATFGVPLDPRWSRSLASFQSRLRWHCHFMQKLEDEPALENRNLSRAYDGLRRENDFNEEHFAAWCGGRTGYPMVDACMRALHQGGWINFRMRAMLASFAAYHLWLPWQPTSVFLARLFLDYEPGIHYAQFQMQSGTTGINSVRIYSPAKQVLDQDPQGAFIRRFVPELARVPAAFLAEPHLMPTSMQAEAGCRVGHDYPAPVVEHAAAYRQARERMGAIRRTEHARAEAQRVYARHGSRERPLSGRPGVARKRRPAGRPSVIIDQGQGQLALCAA